MTEKIIAFPRQLELPLKWYEIDWSHGGVITTVSRPTEDMALENVAKQSRIMSKHGMPEFCELDWAVYFKDMELKFKHQNANTVTAIDISKALPMSVEDIEKTLRRIDAIMELRDMLGQVALPPIPMQFLDANRKVQKLQKELKESA
jgi:hypothetical protein